MLLLVCLAVVHTFILALLNVTFTLFKEYAIPTLQMRPLVINGKLFKVTQLVVRVCFEVLQDTRLGLSKEILRLY